MEDDYIGERYPGDATDFQWARYAVGGDKIQPADERQTILTAETDH